MLSKYLVALFLAAAEALVATVLQKRAQWYAKKGGEECRAAWAGDCYGKCFRSGIKSHGRKSDKARSKIVKVECGIFQKRCQCEC